MIRYKVPFSEYVEHPGLNQSKLGALKKCPAKFKWLLDNSRPDTDALSVGRAIHTAVLEPDNFNDEFFCLPELDRRTTKGKEAYAEIVASNPGKTILKPEAFNTAIDVALAVRTNPHCAALLKKTEKEITLDWEDSETKTLCKARVDAWDKKRGIVIDIKTTQDASRFGFPRKLHAYGYHRQAAWYLDALRHNGEVATHFVFIAVEKEPPYAIGIYRLTDEAIRLSRQENEALLRTYAECMKTNDWPGYTNGIEDISLPDYILKDMEDEDGQPF